LRAGAEEALAEITRLESILSLYLPASEISNINKRGVDKPVPVSPEVFMLLERSIELSNQTKGAFDITIAPLVNCWRFMNDTGSVPTENEIENACALVGIEQVKLNSCDSSVQLNREGVMLDLGSIGKGYALEQASTLLLENKFNNFLIHGGTSTVCAAGTQADGTPWRIAVEHQDEDQPPLHIVDLENESLSVSGIGGKSFIDEEGVEQGHVIDPHTGRPTQAAIVTAVVCDSATASDAWATALLVDPNLQTPPALRVLI
jgi:thiamine biosynthesis lipoprotein